MIGPEDAGQRLDKLLGRLLVSVPRSHVFRLLRKGEVRLNGSGRLVIRPSGTEPVIRVMAEGDDRTVVEAVVRDIVEAIQAAA